MFMSAWSSVGCSARDGSTGKTTAALSPKFVPSSSSAEEPLMTDTRHTHRPATLAGTFSFYVPSSDLPTLAVADSVADARTIRGPKGPAVVRQLRRDGWESPVMF